MEFDSPLFDRFMDDLEENTSTESYQEAITRLLMTLPQWQHVHLYLDLGELPVFEDLLIGAFQVDVHVDGNRRLAPVPCPDVLESVTLAISDAPYEDNPVMLPDAFQSAPNLTSFTLLKPHLDPDPSFASIWPTCGLPWTQIREITLDYNDLDILRDIPEEVYTDGKPLTLTISSKSPEWETDEVGSPTLVFDKITALHLHPESWTNDLPEFLHDISMPALQDLTLSCLLMSDAHDWRRNQSGAYRVYADNTLGGLTSMVSRSKCALKAFTFKILGDGYKSSDKSFAQATIALLREAPELETLRLIEGKMCGPPLFTEEFFKVCTMPGGLVPKLKSLELVWAGTECQPSKGLIPMLESRLGGPLTSVVLGVRNGGRFRSKILECVRQLRAGGVQASLW